MAGDESGVVLGEKISHIRVQASVFSKFPPFPSYSLGISYGGLSILEVLLEPFLNYYIRHPSDFTVIAPKIQLKNCQFAIVKSYALIRQSIEKS